MWCKHKYKPGFSVLDCSDHSAYNVVALAKEFKPI